MEGGVWWATVHRITVRLHTDHKHLDPRVVGTRRLMIKIPKTSSCYLTTNQSEECLSVDHKPVILTPNAALKKKPSLQSIREFRSFEHELSILLDLCPANKCYTYLQHTHTHSQTLRQAFLKNFVF